ncbi:MAG: hypothetical protein OXH66_03440 [Gemmatimonadetes bacterium]|nr:hypothetical protein [Gemmatimonadota bacterium]
MNEFEAREKLAGLTPQQRLENLEYLAFRLFMQQTELPDLPEPEPKPSTIVTVDDFGQPTPTPQPHPIGIPYDMAFARAGVEQVLMAVGGDASIPHLLHAIRAGIVRFNKEAQEAIEAEEGKPN